MKQTPILSLAILIISSQVCFGQDTKSPPKDADKSARHYAFEISIDARNQNAWLRFIKEEKALCVVRTRKGYVKVDLEQKTVGKIVKSQTGLGAKFDTSAFLDMPDIPAMTELYKFLERSGHGPKKSMKGMFFFPKGGLRKLEKLAEAACYKHFIPAKDATEVVFNYRGVKLSVAEIEFRESGTTRRLKVR